MTLSQMATFQVKPSQFITIACMIPQHSHQMANATRNCKVVSGEVAKFSKLSSTTGAYFFSVSILPCGARR